MLALLCKRSGDVTYGQDHAVSVDLEGAAVFGFGDHAVFQNLGNAGLQMHGHLVGIEEVTQEAGVRQADALHCDQVVLHLYDGRLLAL